MFSLNREVRCSPILVLRNSGKRLTNTHLTCRDRSYESGEMSPWRKNGEEGITSDLGVDVVGTHVIASTYV